MPAVEGEASRLLRRTTVVRWCLVACAALVWAGCGHSEEDSARDADGKTVVTYWRHHNGPENDALLELISRFEDDHPTIRIDLKTFPFGVYTTKVVAALTTGLGPDIVNIHGSWAHGYIGSGLILPLPEELFPRAELDEQFFPLTRTFTRDGAYYAIPIGGSNLGLYYNVTMFREAGIEGPPRTWSELQEVAQRLTRRDRHGRLLRSGASLGNMRGSGNGQMWNYFVDGVLPQAGIEPLAADGRSVRWDTPEGAAALTWFTDFARGDDAPNSTLFPGAFDQFRLGLSAMMIDGNWAMGALSSVSPDLDYATAPVPTSDEGGRATYGSIWGNAVTRQTSGETQAAAWTFLSFLATYESMVYWSEQTGEMPMRTRVLDDAAFLANIGRRGPFLEQMAYARMSPKKDEALYKGAIIDAADQILLNDVDPATALHDAAERVNAMLSER